MDKKIHCEGKSLNVLSNYHSINLSYHSIYYIISYLWIYKNFLTNTKKDEKPKGNNILDFV